MRTFVDNYEKGESVEVPDDSGLQFDANVIHMRVKQGSNIQKLMGFALKKIREPGIKQLTWNGFGSALSKTISCAEIMKRKIKGLHQITKIRFKRTEEIWYPKQEGLERLKVNHDVPSITILLSLEALDEKEPGYQAPGNIDPFWKKTVPSTEKRNAPGNKRHEDKNKKSRHTGPTENSSLDPPAMGNPRKKRQKRRDAPENGGRASNKQEQRKTLTVQKEETMDT